jgi:WD40 repeat protein
VGAPLHEEISPPSEIPGERIVAVRSVPNSSLFVASTMSTTDLWDGQSKRRITSFPGMAISCSPDGRWIVAAGGSILKAEARVLEAATGKLVRRLRGGHDVAITSAVWSPNSQFLFTSGADGLIRRWDTKTGQVLLEP